MFEDLRALQKYVGKENVPIPAHLGDIPGNNSSVSTHYKQLLCILMHSAGHLLVFLISIPLECLNAVQIQVFGPKTWLLPGVLDAG